MSPRLALLACLCCVASLCLAGDEPQTCIPWNPDIHADNPALVIDQIDINPRNIFNPNNPLEQAWYHKLGNDLHILTRPETIAAQLIVSRGDTLNLRRLEESERLLRSKSYIKSASVQPTQVCGNKVNIAVSTVDHWSFTPSFSFDTVGGENTSTSEIEESNLLGFGKHFRIEYDDGLDRTSRSIYYSDPNLLGSRLRLQVSSLDNSDGNGSATQLSLPFYHLDSRLAWSIRNSDLEEYISLYDAGEVFNRFGKASREWDLSGGWSKGLQGNSVSRYRLGWYYSDKAYHTLADTLDGSLPEDRTLSYPWFSYQKIIEDYVEIPNLTTMDETRDVGIGHRYSVLVGAASKTFGSDANYGILQLAYSGSHQPGLNQLNQIRGKITSTLGNGYQKNTRFSTGFDWYHFQSERYTWYLGGTLVHNTHPIPDTQVLLGGETGLRGYPVRYQAGQSKVLLSAEQRHLYSVYPWRLIQLASAVFVDVGSAWDRGEHPDWLSDVGLGLRIFPTRSTGSTVIHVDVAFPVAAPDDVDSAQFNITTHTGF